MKKKILLTLACAIAAALILGAWWCLLEWRETRRTRWLILIALAFGWSAITRPAPSRNGRKAPRHSAIEPPHWAGPRSVQRSHSGSAAQYLPEPSTRW